MTWVPLDTLMALMTPGMGRGHHRRLQGCRRSGRSSGFLSRSGGRNCGCLRRRYLDRLSRRGLNHRSGCPDFRTANLLNFDFKDFVIDLDLKPTHGVLLLAYALLPLH